MATNLPERSKYVVVKIDDASGTTWLWRSDLGPTGQFVRCRHQQRNVGLRFANPTYILLSIPRGTKRFGTLQTLPCLAFPPHPLRL